MSHSVPPDAAPVLVHSTRPALWTPPAACQTRVTDPTDTVFVKPTVRAGLSTRFLIAGGTFTS